jgi:hypothetical protein
MVRTGAPIAAATHAVRARAPAVAPRTLSPREVADLEPVGFLGVQAGAVGGEQGRQRVGVRGRYGHDVPARGLLDEVVHRGVGQDAALADDQQVVGDQLHLAHQVRGQEHRASLLGLFGE